MNDAAVGRIYRALRIRRGWRQVDAAGRAGVGADAVGLLEHGHVDRLSVRTLRRLWSAVGLGLELDPRMSPAERSRLLDAGHAALVDRTARTFHSVGWTTVVELTFNEFGERGAVDLVAWHAGHRALALVEVKTRLPDIQELHSTFDRKARVVPPLLARERGWRAEHVGLFLVIAATSTNRRVVRDHAATFRSSFPGTSTRAASWVRDPRTNLGAIWFVPFPAGTRSYDVLRRVRRARAP